MLIEGSDLKRLRLSERMVVIGRDREVFRVTRYEAMVLIGAMAVKARIYPKDFSVKYFQLLIPVQSYFRLLKGIRHTASTSGTTRAIQSPGAKRWVVRLDRADGGIPGRTVQVQCGRHQKDAYRDRLSQVLGIKSAPQIPVPRNAVA